MNHRERVRAILNYGTYDRLPIVHFGYWRETMQRWVDEGHLTQEDIDGWGDGNSVDLRLNHRIGFDFDWASHFTPHFSLAPAFERKVFEELPDGSIKVRNHDGVILLEKPGTPSIPPEIDHLLKTRADWEEHYLPRVQWFEERVLHAHARVGETSARFDQGGREMLLDPQQREYPYGLFCGSLFGKIRDIIGVVGVSYLFAEDPDLYDEIINTVGALCYRCVEFTLAQGPRFDFGHFWEDICFKNGPLVIPSVFEEKVGPHYRRITDLLRAHDITIVSLDCDGCIDALIPTWLSNGVNTMFPIEVGTWRASIAPWRERYGRELRGVGGMNKNVFARDFAAVDAEIERLKPLIALGGYIPCPDHRLAPDAEWDNVRYYCDRMRAEFG